MADVCEECGRPKPVPMSDPHGNTVSPCFVGADYCDERLAALDCKSHSAKGDCCTGCRRHDRKLGTCEHFGPLALRVKTKNTWHRHPNCIRAEERTNHASYSALMMKGDFDGE